MLFSPFMAIVFRERPIMSAIRCLLSLSLAFFVSASVLAQEPKAKQPNAKQPKTPTSQQPNLMHVYLMDGGSVFCSLSVQSITVDTEFGKLEIPVSQIVSFTPGLNSHPQQRSNINRLIRQLGASTADLRKAAQADLARLGVAIQKVLQDAREDKDAERRKRIGELLQLLEETSEDDDFDGRKRQELIDEDTVETTLFTVVGKISPDSFQLRLNKFGSLTVALSDILRVEQDTDEKPEINRTVTVSGSNLALINYKNSGIRVAQGDKIYFKASGSIVMSPWGNNESSQPDGNSRFGQYKPGIHGGTLIARIGSSGKEFKVGKGHSFTAKKSGTLYFAIAMQAQFANRNYSFPGEYKVKVRINSK